jgi:type VI secretion system VasD/TssJ family lipoprotein
MSSYSISRIGAVLVLVAGLLMIGGCCTIGYGPCTLKDQFTLKGATTLNACGDDGRSHPVAVRFYALKDAEKFQSAAFEDLWDNAAEVLGGDLLDDPVKAFVQPGGTEAVSILRPDGAKAIGVLANFCERNEESYRRKIYELGKRGASQELNLSGQRMTSN